LLVATDLLGDAEEFAAAGRESPSAVLETQARELIDLALVGMA
jgi:hypothetical protein